ncbi:23S rRNA (adenine(2030)-N(6))-methyltransferase RlmJ [Ottowia sp. SB7-C50]|uniref:23S rRNA (adenine(2030)-N(6))-methyltransferase RlmJ n=1 Tax=Ottowia sp. SB7-C50 TaxID=3081231 RepID=UPI002952EDDE|nr:23S rRNA (adenine(2030)-N(6))-methyltransferase RlmJ [Ottowia sp. SB7-C50]WOP15111.1 23S rRNA (adenine(2030)-N(6))-methyltransferase RlmJ [Ottowia sp. SB7-C50]
MFSYRHAFHAGNHADVLKHLTLLATLRHLMRKPTPLLLVDTHAGAGIYRLDSDAAQTSGEAGEGIARLQATPAPSHHRSKTVPAPASSAQGAMQNEALADYLEVVARFNPAARGAWRVYPGSPLLMHALMTEPDRAVVHDRLKLFELHPTDAQALRAHIDQLDAGRQVTMTRQDGLAGLKALLPPPPAAGGSRRALVLIDPSYEIKSDYAKVAEAVQDALKRFATGVYLVWYPIIPRPEAHGLPRRLRTLAQQAGRAWLDATLHIGAAADGAGLTASGMFVINPPHTLKALLDDALPQVLDTLREGRGRGAAWSVEAGAARA